MDGIKDDLDKVVVLYNGVIRFQKVMPKKLKQIIYVGRIVKEKGVDLFVEAIKEIYKDFKDWNFKIIGTPRPLVRVLMRTTANCLPRPAMM